MAIFLFFYLHPTGPLSSTTLRSLRHTPVLFDRKDTTARTPAARGREREKERVTHTHSHTPNARAAEGPRIHLLLLTDDTMRE